MKKITVFAFFCVAMLLAPRGVRAKEWRGIVPLRSTRADVERVLGAPATDRLTGSCRCVYQLKDEIVHVVYASGRSCAELQSHEPKSDEWNVPFDTVIEMIVSFKKDQPLSEFKIDEKYKEEIDGHAPGLVFYTNREDGIRLEGGKLSVSSVSYFPAAKYNYLHCPKKIEKSVDPCKSSAESRQ